MPLSSSSVDRRIPEALSTSRERNLILKARSFPMPGQESLRTSLCTPSADSFLAMSVKSALGETSNDSRSSFGSPPCSSVMVRSPVLLAKKARSCSLVSSTSPLTWV
jgi:hypothetical protein